ncbi:MAG: zf-HC2 domain-containing protein [Treponema sp.]|jgi:hypothetical protein|nr:zf-HC2 domain-containing protein [Treponema sp.]
MCPDRQILSVYLDGELPSPWKEKMESHLSSCARCRETIETWERISSGLREGEGPGPGERVWERICGRIEAADTLAGSPALWRRRVSLPLPAAAALGAAAAVLLFVSSSLLLKPAGPALIPDSAISVLETAGIDMELKNIGPFSDVSGVLQYLESTDSNDIVIIRLPESRSFQTSGEPKIIRAADYSSRRPGP